MHPPEHRPRPSHRRRHHHHHRACSRTGLSSLLGVSVAGLYAAGRYSQPHASSALATIRERLPSCPSLPLIGSNSGGGGGGAGGATAASSAASDLDSENLSLAPVLVSIGRKASAHIPGEGMPEMVKAGLGEAGHSF